MKLPNAAQVKQWDEYTIRHEPISSLSLMERASARCTEWIVEQQLHNQPIKIFCGKGNNGGDGLAIARQLINIGSDVAVYIIESATKDTDDFQSNLKAFQLSANVNFLHPEAAFPELNTGDIVIDALFGSGLNRKLEGLPASLINHINNSTAKVISIDVPSGMFIDKSSKRNTIIQADHTLTFQTMKPCFLSAGNSEYFGKVHVLDIGLHYDFLKEIQTDIHLTGINEAQQIFRPRNEFAHKGNFGHALIIGGAEGKLGAAIIATEACLRSGAGLTSVYLVAEDYTAVQVKCPEAMTVAGDEMVKQHLDKFNAVGIGPGLGTSDIAHHLLTLVLTEFKGALVLDADALNILSADNELLQQLPANTILTPHPKEFDRLFGEHADEFARWYAALLKSQQLNCIIVLKGHYTLVAANGKGYFNISGNPGLAKGGSGDALTGIITSLLAQKYAALDAAKLGVFLHGLAADLAINHQSHETLLASDIFDHLAQAFKMLQNVR